jgi:uncharacterized protein YbjQ (UPF0145 family)
MKEKILNKLSDIGDKSISLSTNTNTVIFNYPNCYLGSNIPGKIIKESFGLVNQITSDTDGKINTRIDDLMKDFLTKVQDIGGNAVINLRYQTGSYEANGSKWHRSYMLIYGEAVLIENII